jgi:glycine betaine/proline transport system substrate-binding protein
MRRVAIGVLLASVLALALAGCADSDEVSDTPGVGTSVTMARATWSTGWFQAEIYASLLRRLGYQVSDPADLELTQQEFYEGAARGEIDLWANGWFPDDEQYLEQDVDEVGRIGDAVEPVGLQVEQGALAGILIDSATATRERIRTLGQIVADPRLVRSFDFDGNGKADILGCPPKWACKGDIDALIAEAGPDALEQVSGDRGELEELALRLVQARRPVLLYAWTPTATIERLVPGEEVRWLDTSPAGAPDKIVLERGYCTRVRCRMGFPPNDIRVAANSRFLDENPAARELFEQVKIPVEDIQAQNLAMEGGADRPADLASQAEQWLGERRGEVLDWLRAAREAANDG